MQRIAINVPYPDGALLQNSRKHWTVKGGVASEARMVARSNAQKAMGTHRWTPAPLRGEAYIWPPDKRRRDTLNAAAALKPSIDGIFDALGVDDELIREWKVVRGNPRPGGFIIIVIEEIPA